MSFYAEYLTERTNDCIIESEHGFAVYRYLDDKTVYIVDIYVTPSSRKTGHASGMANFIAKQAKKTGRSEMIGSVVPSMKGSTDGLKVLMSYGMKLKSCSDDFIILSKEI